MAKVQRVNVSKQTFGAVKFGNATAALDSKGSPGGSFTASDLQNNPLSGLPVPAAVTGMTPIVNNGASSKTVITLTGNQNEVTIQGEYNEDAGTVRLIDAEVVAMKINGVDVAPTVDPQS
jgi:hypothetical protein